MGPFLNEHRALEPWRLISVYPYSYSYGAALRNRGIKKLGSVFDPETLRNLPDIRPGRG